MKLTDVLRKECIVARMRSSSKAEAIEELVDALTAVHDTLKRDVLVDALMQREKLCSTALDEGVAIPHAKVSGVTSIVAAFGRSPDGIDFDSLDGKPTHLFILIIAPEDSAGSHLKLLARVSNMFRSREFRSRLLNADSADKIYEIVAEEDARFKQQHAHG